jgi:beta-aspartyl-peptidase (threonine type)
VRHPIRLAREVMRSDHVLLVGDGAERFAREHGVETCDPCQFIVERERKRLATWLSTTTDPDPKSAFDRPPIESSDPRGPRAPLESGSGGARDARRPRVVDPLDSRSRPLGDDRDGGGPSGPSGKAGPPGPRGTVGCVAVDRGGNLAAGGSTGGTPGKPSGRVGDTPIAGAGLWADNRMGAAACTGWGEGILRVGLARSAVSYLRDASAQDAAYLAVREMESRVDGRAGIIVLSRDGSLGFAFNTPRMAVAFMDEELAQPFVK